MCGTIDRIALATSDVALGSTSDQKLSNGQLGWLKRANCSRSKITMAYPAYMLLLWQLRTVFACVFARTCSVYVL